MDKESKCPICGKPTFLVYGNPRQDKLCKEHGLLANNGQIEQCPDCGEWHKTGEDCECHNTVYTELPVSGFEKCILCGNQTNGYAFCRECWSNYSNDELLEKLNKHVKNKQTLKNKQEDNKISSDEKKNDKNESLQNNSEKAQKEITNCIVCGKPSNGRLQCKECYNETKNHIDELDKNKTVRQLRDYYYNLKERIVIINSLQEAQYQCNKLIAIAAINQNQNDDSSLIDRVYNDVKNLLSKKAPQVQKHIEEIIEKDQTKSKINTAEDGHNVDSDMEVRIDDALYHSFILHNYGKNITEILEKRKKCDWFIPIANGEGIYIEYWGKDTPEYLAERKEKEELYTKYDIPYISIEKDDPKKDTQTFTNNLVRDITKLAKDRFGFMPKWKK